MNNLSISNVINIQVSEPGAGLGRYNTSNLAIYSTEVPESSFGTAGYKIYLTPTEVAEDFGTNSKTYAMALSVFGQAPNILANNGYLVVITMDPASVLIEFDAVADDGDVVVNYGGTPSAAILFDDSATIVAQKIKAIAGFPQDAVITGSVATSISISFGGTYEPLAITTSANTLEDATVPVVIDVTSTVGEDFEAAVTAGFPLIQHHGLIPAFVVNDATAQAVAAIVQAENKILGLVFRDLADNTEVTGIIDVLRLAGYKKTRSLLYVSGTETDALKYLASYFGRGLSTNFNGSNTTQTMHLKSLVGVAADTAITQSVLNTCKITGADVYVSIEGVPKCFTSGANDFFDNVYNLSWLVGDLKVAGFNLYAQTPTKIPQTEIGVDLLKKVYGDVLEQGIVNGFVAPGSWTDPSTFGNQADFFANITERGYYLYAIPLAQQSASARALREAPLVQIAVKYAGAQHSSTVIINVNP